MLANGVSVISDRVFSGRWAHIPEYIKLGADIVMRDNVATISGRESLSSAHLRANDMRGAAALLFAAAASEGETQIDEIGYVHRGYQDIPKHCEAVGIDATWF